MTPKRVKRCKVEIIHDILSVAKDNNCSTKTKLQQMAYIDWRGFRKYFDFLIYNGFISKCNNFPDHYEITEKGKKFLKQLNNFENLADIQNFNL